METDFHIEADGHDVVISHPEKQLFPDAAITKRDLADYYLRIGPVALPHWRGRAVTMQRFPEGIDAEGFFQKTAGDYFPDWIETAELPKEGGAIRQVVAQNAATFVYLANLGMITPHLGLSRVDRPEYPDRAIFDLDPPGADFAPVQRAAEILHRHFDKSGIANFAQTTGSRGMHVVIPLERSRPFDTVRALMRRFCEGLADRFPDEMTVEQRKEKRGQRLYLDIGRNAYAQTAVAPYGVRAKPDAPVATPLDWDEALSADMSARKYGIGNIFRRLGAKSDPWKAIDHAAVPFSAFERALS